MILFGPSLPTLSLKAALEPLTPGPADILFWTENAFVQVCLVRIRLELARLEMSPPLGFKALPLSIKHLSLPVVLKCGQSFRWQKVALDTIVSESHSDAEWRLTLQDR